MNITTQQDEENFEDHKSQHGGKNRTKHDDKTAGGSG